MAPVFSMIRWCMALLHRSALIGCVLGGAMSGVSLHAWGVETLATGCHSVLPFGIRLLLSLNSFVFEYGKPNMELLIAFNLYRVLGGIGVGLASAVCPMYIAEIAPSNIRGTLVSCNQFAIILVCWWCISWIISFWEVTKILFWTRILQRVCWRWIVHRICGV